MTWRSKVRYALTIGLVVIFAGLGAMAFWFGPQDLVVARWSLAVLPPGSAPMTVVAIADTQPAGPHQSLAQLARVVELANQQNGDMIVLLGDYVSETLLKTRFIDPEDSIPLFAALDAPMGVYGVLGNHDWRWDGRRMVSLLRDAGVIVLEDQAVLAAGGGHAAWIGGVADRDTRRPDIAGTLSQVDDSAPVLLLTHNPDVFPDVPQSVALTLAGHTHGGQVDLPVVGRMIVPSRYGQRFAYGHIVEEGRNLLVSSGIGTAILPVRFRVPPEIAVIELTAR